MKKIKNIIAALAVAVCGLFSCSDWLELAPEDTLSSAIYYTNTQEIFTGVMSAYNRMQAIYLFNRLPQMIEDASDDANNTYFGNSRVNLFSKTMDDAFQEVWQYSYQMIFRCNYLIQIIDDGKYSAVTEADKRDIQAMYGELHFMRALGFFNLVRIYGPVPKAIEVFGEPTAAFGIGRAPVAELYNDVIIPDLEVAVASCYPKNELPTSQIGRVTKGAAQTLLAKVFLTPPVKDLNKAKTQLEGVINSGLYTLQPTYAAVFNKSNKNHSESIFEIQYNPNLGQGSEYYRWMSNESGLTNGLSGCGGAVVPSVYDMYEVMKANEERFHVACDSGGFRGVNLDEWYFQPAVIKHATYGTGNLPQDHNYMLLRYADVMLMYAEVLSETGGSNTTILDYVNPIRLRAKTPAWTEADVNYDAIMLERRMELCFEGHRWFDLLRQGNAKAIATIEAHFRIMEDPPPAVPRTVPEYQLIFPIPNGQIQIDPTLEQNYGY